MFRYLLVTSLFKQCVHGEYFGLNWSFICTVILAILRSELWKLFFNLTVYAQKLSSKMAPFGHMEDARLNPVQRSSSIISVPYSGLADTRHMFRMVIAENMYYFNS